MFVNLVANRFRATGGTVTSLALLERARAWEWVKDPLFVEEDRGVEKIRIKITHYGKS